MSAKNLKVNNIEKNAKNILVHEDGGFTTLLNETINNIRNALALGIYCYLASKPGNWEICKKHLQNHFDIGRDKIDGAFAFLKKVGAIEAIKIRDEKGRITEWKTILRCKLPKQPEYKECSIQNTGFQYSGDFGKEASKIKGSVQITENPLSGKTAPTNKRIKQIKDLNKQISASSTKSEQIYKVKPNTYVESTFDTAYQDFGAELLKQEYSREFEDFWNVYPRKKNKRHAYAHWQHSKLDAKVDDILKKLNIQKHEDGDWQKGYIPMPANYIIGERWNDDIMQAPEKRETKKGTYAPLNMSDTSWGDNFYGNQLGVNFGKKDV